MSVGDNQYLASTVTSHSASKTIKNQIRKDKEINSCQQLPEAKKQNASRDSIYFS